MFTTSHAGSMEQTTTERHSMEAFDRLLGQASAKLDVNFDLKVEQVEALKSLYHGKDTVCLLRTGFGKSVIYQLTPFLLEEKVQNSVTIVISPLNSIMQDQVLKLCQQGVKACYLDMRCQNGETYEFQEVLDDPGFEGIDSDEVPYDSDLYADDTDDEDCAERPSGILQVSVPIDKVVSGGYRLIYAHPEAFLSSPIGMDLIRDSSFQDRVCCIAIDEAHMITEWGETFRKDFSRLQDLLALCPTAPALVLTATASISTKDQIIAQLGLRTPTVISVNPDRPNIMYFKFERSPSTQQFDDLDDILNGIAQGLSEQEREYPITIMYFTNCDNIAYAYRYLEEALENKQYVGEPIPENRLFGMYHQSTSQHMKAHVVSQLGRRDSKVRIVLATIALGMGLDAPAIRKIIHFGSPSSVEKYLQETGRAGRDGQLSTVVLYFNRTDIRANRPGQTKAMVDYCKAENTCLRKLLLQSLDYDLRGNRLLCRCCQFCKPLCNCLGCSSR